uniref:Thrombospondin, type I, domain containing 7Ba n=1 Tax=Eptatretus burgeri TaxID=7764 RepID=A0A8C4NEQ3_EPTBU
MLLFIFLQILISFDSQWIMHLQGSWEQCVGDGCGPGGVQVRKVWCVHREGWTTLRSKCLKAEIEGVLERPTVRRSCFQVCAEHRRLVEWQPGPWMECRPHQVPDLKSEYPDCGSQDGWPGWQRRMTGCVWRADGVPVPDEVCASFHERPLQRQQCSAPCPSDCVVSEFTPWSNCSHFCDSEDNSSTGFQIRTRAVLVPPTHGGAACQNLTEIQPCFSVSNCESFAYSLRVSRWSECMPMHPTARIQRKSRYLGQHDANVHGGTNNETDKVHVRGHPKSHHKSGRHSGRTHNRKRPSRHVRVGYRSRQVECVRSDGKIVPLLRCGSENPPTSSQACLLPRDCRVSAWSHWGACSRTCVETSLRSLSIPGFRERKRSMKVIPLGGAKACPTLILYIIYPSIGTILCAVFAWQVAEWGECQPGALLSNGDRRTGLCGGGLRFREVYCIQVNTDVSDSHQMLLNEQDQRPVDDSLCRAQKPTEEELCSIPCPADCLVSEWSTWSFCVPQSCPTTILTQPGFKLRRRSVLVQQTEGGLDDCPYLAEAVSCINTTCVQWKPTKRAKCVAHKGSSCGSGFLQQKVTCVDDLGLEVPTTMCAEQVIPLQGKACFLPCPGQCVLAQWSPWTQCSLTCSDGENNGQQSRAREILAYPASGECVADCPGSEALGEQRACAQHGCSIYHWDAGPWGLCASDSSSAVGNGNSAIRDVAGTETCRLHGIQSRKVICIRIGVGQVAPMNCPERLRPEPVKACTVPCRRDCMTTPFSEWSPCPDSCHNGHETQFRWRIVVWHPSGGGKECPSPLVEERPCKKVSTCHPFRWQTHRWRTCHLAPQAIHKGIEGDGETCGHGLQIRAISCRRGAGPSLDATECLVHAGPMPPLTQTCCVACRHDCTFTAWSRFSSCSGGCGMMRSRRRSLIGRSRRIDKCKDEKLYPLKETHQCHCQNFSTRPVGPWSDCLLPETISPSGAMLSPAERRASNDNLCGRGTRSRTLACFDIAGLLMPMAKCGPDHYAEEPCVVTCPLDCRLSEWSGWSPCSKTCGSGLRVRSKWLREMARGGGQPCPRLNATSQASVYEVVPCHASCQQYFWMTGPWFACNVTQPQESCNISNSSELQSRRVWCVVNKAEGPGQEVASSLCDSMLPPPVQRPCFHPCPDHCVLGEWEAWTSCTQPCNGSRFQRRTRSMLRPPDNGSSCPPTEEKRPCTFNYNCFHYHYNLTGALCFPFIFFVVTG